MEKKTILPAVGIALAACIALMLTVIGGLYAYNTFASDAQPAYAQSTEVGPKWTVTSVTVGGNKELIVVITEDENAYDKSTKSRQMSVYEVTSNGTARAELYFVAARLLEYDSKFPFINDQATNKKGFEPINLREQLQKEKK
jgi:uncharacterized protein YxeA